MMIHKIEEHDWNTDENDTGEERRLKSIESYHLKPKGWYEKIKDLTFATSFYSEIPNMLPYDKCMVRLGGESPKDSEYWGPVSTKEETVKLFHTSFLSKRDAWTAPNRVFCFREWITIYDEFRCFWNGTLCAVSGNDQCHLNDDLVDKIMIYAESNKHRIPFVRCVFDICFVREGEDLILKIIEFNSWETNSGAHLFDWNDDTEIFYENLPDVYFKSVNYSTSRPKFIVAPLIETITHRSLPDDSTFLVDDNSLDGCKLSNIFLIENQFEILQPTEDTNYVVSNGYVYMSNDIWLGKFTMNLEPVSWIRGNFRFTRIGCLKTGLISAGGNVYNDHKIVGKTNGNSLSMRIKHRYGCKIRTSDGILWFAYLNSDCKFTFMRVL